MIIARQVVAPVLIGIGAMLMAPSLACASFRVRNDSDKNIQIAIVFTNQGTITYRRGWYTVHPGVSKRLDTGPFNSQRRYWLVVRQKVDGRWKSLTWSDSDSALLMQRSRIPMESSGHNDRDHNRYLTQAILRHNFDPLIAHIDGDYDWCYATKITPRRSAGNFELIVEPGRRARWRTYD